MSLQKVRQTVAALVEIGALRQEGEANRDGTLYTVLLPEEIPVCIKRRQERTRQTATIPATEAEADFYNVRENRIKIYERDDYKCGHCGSNSPVSRPHSTMYNQFQKAVTTAPAMS